MWTVFLFEPWLQLNHQIAVYQTKMDFMFFWTACTRAYHVLPCSLWRLDHLCRNNLFQFVPILLIDSFFILMVFLLFQSPTISSIAKLFNHMLFTTKFQSPWTWIWLHFTLDQWADQSFLPPRLSPLLNMRTAGKINSTRNSTHSFRLKK